MANKYLDYDGLLYFWQKIKVLFVSDVTYDSSSKKIQKTKAGSTSDVVTLSTVATSGSYNDLSNKPTIPTLKNVFGKVKVGSTTVEADTTQDTLELVAGSNITLTPDSTNDKVTIATTAEVNQNAFSNVKVGSTTVAADAKTDTLELVAGNLVTLTPDATNDKVTIATKQTVLEHASDSDTPSGAISVLSGDMATSVNIPVVDVVDGIISAAFLPVATTSTKGAMSSADKTKLNGIATGAEVNQNAFSNVKVGSTTVAADGKTDTLELVGDSNGITITPDATNDKVTFTLSLDSAPTASSSKAATSGSIYNALSNKANLSDLATVATSGSYNDLNDTPTIPTLKNVFGKVKVGSTTVEADTTQDTLELAGSNVTLTPDATNDKVTIGITASNVTTALGNTAVARATGDASGNSISGTYAPKASPALTGTPTAPTATAGTNTTQIATTAFVKNAVDTAITGSASFQGTAPTTFAPTNYKKGWYWVVGTAGTYAGQVCEVGDMIFCIKDYASAYAAADFDVIQTNLDIIAITNAEIDTVVAS